MKRFIVSTSVVLMCAATACKNWGTRPTNAVPATGPQGARVAVRVRGESSDRVGELFAVDSIGVIVRDVHLTRVAWPRLAAMDVRQFGSEYDVSFDEVVTASKRARLAPLSRFPQGLSGSLLRSVLSALNQSALEEVHAQASSAHSITSLAAAAASATMRYADRRVAAADGYRRLGPDFPGMGEHWLHPVALLSGALDANRPTILIYATIAGEPTLLGVAFVTTTRGSDAAGDVPGWPDAWHEHSGLLVDESGVSPGASAPSDTHVWVLHAWTRLANPDGAFMPDNWALPFLRAQLAAPPHADPGAALALSLLNGGNDYLRDVLTDAGMRTSTNSADVDAILADARSRVATVVALSRPTKALTESELAALRTAWQSMSSALRSLLGAPVDRYLVPAHPSPHASHAVRVP